MVNSYEIIKKYKFNVQTMLVFYFRWFLNAV